MVNEPIVSKRSGFELTTITDFSADYRSKVIMVVSKLARLEVVNGVEEGSEGECGTGAHGCTLYVFKYGMLET